MTEPQQPTILVVDDEENILEVVSYNLKKAGCRVLTASTGEEGLAIARTKTPDLIVLDLMLPGMDGLEVCRRLKADKATKRIRIVMLTARGEETDVVVGLELGADDYVTKPFSPRILTARVRAALRRPEAEAERGSDAIRSYGDIRIDSGRHVITVKDEPVDLTATEFQLLSFLIRRPGWVFTRSQIVDAVRGDDYPVTDRSVDVHIASLRKKLGPAGSLVDTVRGIGYRMKDLT